MTKTTQKPRHLKNTSMNFWIVIVVGLILEWFFIVYSLSKGLSNTGISDVVEMILHFDASNQNHLILWDIRMPRIIASALVGAALAVAGAIMQGVTQNPMADSSLMGINSGAAFALAICFAFVPNLPFSQVVLFSFIGAAFSAVLVMLISSSQKSSSVRMVLSGVAISTFLTAISQGIAVYYKVDRNIMFFTSGGVAGTNWQQLKIVAIWIILALIAAVLFSRKITILSLGNEIAQNLGLNVFVTKTLAMVIVLVLAGSAVSVVGSVGFIGLIVPHITRFLVGIDYKRVIPVSMVLGSLLVVVADLVARTISPPFEVPIGAVISLLGVPFFLYLIQRERRID